MNDEIKAGILCFVYLIVLYIGCSLRGAVGAVIIGAGTLIFVGILYSSWLIERVEKRLYRYIDASDKNIDRAIKSNS